LPTEAARDGKSAQPCYPEHDFVERLCAQQYPGAALVMFAPRSPWQRGYLKGETKAWSAATGARQELRLQFNEEILVLETNKAQAGKLHVDQGDSFYALRWNGSCVKLTEEELAPSVPWQKLPATVEWGWLDDNLQEALVALPKVQAAAALWRKNCRGTNANAGAPACVAASQRLTDAVVTAVRGGIELPDPSRRP
jgi:hypothetical protein